MQARAVPIGQRRVIDSIEALKVPSARDESYHNLVVFADRLSTNSSLRVYDDSGIIDAQLP